MSGGGQSLEQRNRIVLIAVVFAGIGLVLAARMASWQVLPQPQLDQQLSALQNLTNTIPATRGNILDATGQYLVASTVSYRISASPRLLSEAQRVALVPRLAGILDLPEEEIMEALSRKGTEYSIVADDVSFWTATQVEDLNQSALRLEVQFGRIYPDNTLAASVLGFLMFRKDGEAQYGLEQYYDRELTGTDGVWRGTSDLYGQQILVNEGEYEPAKDGCDLVLTLDRNIQYQAEQILIRTAQEHKAQSGTIIVLEPTTGAILAMANHPTYSPAEYWNVESNTAYVNQAISAIYEPGSVLKPLTLAAALDARVIRPTDTYDDRGEISVGGLRIYNADLQAHGITTMTELLAYSRNVGAAYVASLLGSARFYETMRKFGFSEITGVDLWGEVPGIMRVPGNSTWHPSDLGANSYGQGLAATPLQVAAAYGALANGGILMRPYIVSEIRSQEGTEESNPFAVRRVISPASADQITAMMADAVEMGMQKAMVSGYRMAGKSGTAGIGEEGYVGDDTIVSFVGYGPLPDPQFVILVKVDRPLSGQWGLDVAAPAFREMAEYLIDYYGLLPDGNRVLVGRQGQNLAQ